MKHIEIIFSVLIAAGLLTMSTVNVSLAMTSQSLLHAATAQTTKVTHSIAY